MKDLSLKRRRADELELLGYTLSGHPLDLFDTSACATARELASLRGRRVTMAGWLIAGKLVRTRGEKRRAMKFLSLEDQTGTFEATLFPDAYARYAPIVGGPGPYRLRGRVEDDLGAVSLVVEHIEPLGRK